MSDSLVSNLLSHYCHDQMLKFALFEIYTTFIGWLKINVFDLQINQRVIELSLPVETESTETKLKGTQHCGLTFRSPHFILPELS